jgi:hypothetical protein
MRIAFLKREIPKRAAAIAVALIAAASVVAGREKPAVEAVGAVESRPAQLERAAAAPEIDLGKLRRGEADAPQSDPFAPRSFAPVQPQQAAKPHAAPAQAREEAPPLPFTYAGWLSQDGKTEVFVVRGDELISIAAGDTIDAQYRVDAITESSIRFTYLPLKKRQSLERDEASG